MKGRELAKMSLNNGICTLVDDCSKQKPRPKFEGLLGTIQKDHGQNPKLEIDFMKDKKRDKFTIIHSAKEVKYDIKSFIVKNVDAISPSLEDIVAQKAEEQISMIYLNNVPDIQEEESEESPRSK